MSTIIQHPSAIVAVKTHHLHDVDNDTKSRLYPGPGVIASITSVSVSKAKDAIRQHRHGSRWLDFPRAPPITGTTDVEIGGALRLLGYVGSWRYLPEQQTLAAYLNTRTGVERDHPCVVRLSTHCVAVSGGVFCDVFSHGIVIDIGDAKGRRKKVSHVLALTKRIAPTITSRKLVSKAKKTDADSKLEELFREAIRLRQEQRASRSLLTRSSSSCPIKAVGTGSAPTTVSSGRSSSPNATASCVVTPPRRPLTVPL